MKTNNLKIINNYGFESYRDLKKGINETSWSMHYVEITISTIVTMGGLYVGSPIISTLGVCLNVFSAIKFYKYQKQLGNIEMGDNNID